jgi:DNA-binding transcriptional ArsR family regulator
MAKLFPFRPESQHESAGPRLVDLDDEVANDVFAALSSDTARRILSRLYRDPATASDVADAADTSLQNARYHLDKLESAGLVEAVDTWYSSRGTEMTVYAPTNEPLVVAAGHEESKGVLRRALERVVGAVTVLALASVVVDRLVRQYGGPFVPNDGSPGDRFDRGVGSPEETPSVSTDGGVNAAATGTTTEVESPIPRPETAMPTGNAERTVETPAPTSTPADTPSATSAYEATGQPADPQAATTTAQPQASATTELTNTATDTVTNTSTPTVELATDGGIDLLSGVPPGGLFFAGGLLVVLFVAAWWYWAQYRPMYG